MLCPASRGGTAFEFYEYTDGETTDGVYNRISYDVSRELEPDEREKYERMLQGGGKRFDFTENGVSSIVVYQGNIVIYAYFPEEEHEIQDMLEELGVDS